MTDNRSNEIWKSLSYPDKDYEKMQPVIKVYSPKSESGSFYIDENGIAQRFEPSEDNPFFDEATEHHDNYDYKTDKSIRTPCWVVFQR